MASGEILSPPFAFMHYHLWEVLQDIPKPQLQNLEKSVEFQGYDKSYLSNNYCKTRAKIELEKMLSRHHGGESFFRYSRNNYYLHDDFADNYNTVAWIVDYGLLPVATEMLKRLHESETKQES
jgi:trehalose-6-phosphate synthase